MKNYCSIDSKGKSVCLKPYSDQCTFFQDTKVPDMDPNSPQRCFFYRVGHCTSFAAVKGLLPGPNTWCEL